MEKNREIRLMVSDEDWKKFMGLCGRCGMTAGDFFTHYINDLLDNHKSNGSDERRFAEGYFNRGGWQWDNSLLAHILKNGENPAEFVSAWDGFSNAKSREDMEYCKDILSDLRAGWKDGLQVSRADEEEEVALMRKWLQEKGRIVEK